MFKIADFDKRLLNLSVISAVLGYFASVVPFVCVYFIASEFLMPQTGSANSQTIIMWIVIAGISIVANMIFLFFGSFGCHHVAFKLINAFKLKVMEHLGKLSMHYFNRKTTGGLQKTIDECGDRVENFIGHMLPDLFGSIFVVLSLFIGIFLLSPWLCLQG